MKNTPSTPPLAATPSKLPIFAAPYSDSKKSDRRVHQVKIGTNPVPLTAEEFAALNARLDSHIENHGVKYGFFAFLFVIIPLRAVRHAVRLLKHD